MIKLFNGKHLTFYYNRLEDKIGHLYIVDIEFDVKNATERKYAYNEIYLPIIEKQ